MCCHVFSFCCMQAFIHSGSSGGAALNSAGHIVGVISHGGAMQQLSHARWVDLATNDYTSAHGRICTAG